jgi:acyl-coenzyme A thioesterase PaaI-like protein
MDREERELRVPARFCGPPGAANGGYLAGRLASLIGGEVEVTLRRATPLERSLRMLRVADGIDLLDGDQLLAEARSAALALEPPTAVSIAQAEAAASAFPRFVDHPIPRCFACGPERVAGDGLRIFPGPVSGGDGIYAAPWVPDASLADEAGTVASEFVWAALDCAGAFAVNEPPRGLALLGKIAARIDRPVAPGEPLIVAAWPLALEGRRLVAGTAVYRADGVVCAAARSTWVLLTRSSYEDR